MNKENNDHILANQLLCRLKEEQRMFRRHSAKPTLSRHERNQCNQLSSFAADVLDDLEAEHQLDTLDLIALAEKNELNNLYH